MDDIHGRGLDMFNALKPFKDASVFDLEFSEQLASDATESGNEAVGRLGKDASSAARDSLDLAVRFMEKKFHAFPSADGESDLDTTSALSGLFFIAAVAVYCPEVLLGGEGQLESKREAGEKFVRFFDERIAVFMDLDVKWADARKFHADIFEIYQAFKADFPGLFQNLRDRLWASQAEFMAPYGSDMYDNGWISYHYLGKL